MYRSKGHALIGYSIINVLAVQWYGESEFWAALGKVLLIVGLLIFTFIVMLGGNPLGDRFGFRCVLVRHSEDATTADVSNQYLDSGKTLVPLPNGALLRATSEDGLVSSPA